MVEVCVTEVFISGDAYERGISYGKEAREAIKRCISHYAVYIENSTGMDWRAACENAKKFEPAIQSFRPEYLEEMRGIADGAQVRYEEILAINCRSELYAMKQGASQECTAFAVMPSASRDGHVLAGQNWDNNYGQRDCMVVVHIYQQHKPDILLFTEAGFIGGKGMNSRGISLTLNALETNFDSEGVPLHIKMRSALDAEHISKAYEAVAKVPSAVGANLILTSGDGMALSAEVTPDGVDAILPEDGVIAHTNHLLSPVLLQKSPDNWRNWGSTFVRLCRLKEMLRDGRDIDKDYLFRVMRDHGGYPYSICYHPEEKEPDICTMASNYSLVMDTTEQAAYFCAGQPCKGNYKEYHI